MKVSIREDLFDDKLCQHSDVGVLQQVIPPCLVEQVLTDCGAWEQRERKLNMLSMIYLLIAQALLPSLPRETVYSHLVAHLRLSHPNFATQLPTKSAISQRLQQLGEAPLAEVFRRLARPRADPVSTPQAFWRGWRVMALDGTLESVPDTPANRATFRYSSDHATAHSPYPLLRTVLLVECGTHLICDVQLCGCREGERRAAEQIIGRCVRPDMLLIWDSGFHASWLLFLMQSKQAQVLGRLQEGTLQEHVVDLPDGSYLTYIYEEQDHHRGERMLVRVISYTFTDARVPSAGQTYRLVTTLLDPESAPGLELAALYHERWHAEEVIDEIKTHLRLSAFTFRAQTPQGVRQEAYGLLLAHVAVRTLMLEAACQAALAPTQLSFSHTVRLWQQTQPYSGLLPSEQRTQWEQQILGEIATARLPVRRLRFQPRVLKGTKAKYEHKRLLHQKVPPLEPDLCFKDLMALVT